MSGFARSFKPSGYLSPRIRPPLGGRTLSSSSDHSTTSISSHSPGRGGNEDSVDAASPGPDYITFPGRVDSHTRIISNDSPGAAFTSFSQSPRTSSRPIAIDLPLPQPFRFQNSSGIDTPPEPLSARGDIPGGYFPLHENPSQRVRRTHPFQHQESKTNRPINLRPATVGGDIKMSTERNQRHEGPGSALSPVTTHVTSYFPSGFHDNPLPIGKYYPSNYEQRGNPTVRTNSAGIESAASSGPQHHLGTGPSTSPADARHRMQQYQRDIVAHAAMVLGSSSNLADGVAGPRELSVKVSRFGPNFYKPRSPRLMPLGSPGPVTPMELESAGGGYLERGSISSIIPRDRRDSAMSSGGMIASSL